MKNWLAITITLIVTSISLPALAAGDPVAGKEMAAQCGNPADRLDNALAGAGNPGGHGGSSGSAELALERIGEVPIYQGDGIVRRAPALQMTRDARLDCVWMKGSLIEQLGLSPGDRVRIAQDGGEGVFVCECDDRLPDGCVRLPSGTAVSAQLEPAFGALTVEPLRGGVEGGS